MKKKLLFLMLSVLTLGAWAETSITDVLPKGATTVFNAKYQYGTRGEGDVWPGDPANDGSDRAWYAKDFDDSSWDTKKVPFGSDLSGDQKWEGEYNCYWLRINFNLDAVDNTATYYFLCRHDDTYKAYINGNLIADRPGWTGDGYCYVPLNNSQLSAGTNVIAVYIQQNYGGSYFDCGVQKYNYQQSDFDTRFKGVEVGNGEYYLYNPASGLWLQNNDRISSDWNTRAQLGTRGLDFTLTRQNNGGYYLQGKFNAASCPSIQADNRYLDTNSADAWHFEKVNVPGLTNAYKVTYWPTDKNDYTLSGSVQNPDHKSNNMFTPSSNIYLDCLRTIINDYSIWVLVTKEQRMAMMMSATNAAPQDATWLIKNADLSDVDDRRNDWRKSSDKFKHMGREGNDNARNCRVYEYYNESDEDNIKFSQTISNLPAGKYRMRVQGFYRYGKAVMFAGSTELTLKSATTTESVGTVALAMNNNNEYVGDWMEFTHGGGDLEIGIKKKERSQTNDWIVFSKFALEYMGFSRYDANGVGYAIVDGGSGFNATTETFRSLLDNDATTKFGTSNQSDAWATIIASEPVAVQQYSLVTGGDTYNYPARNPRSWKLEGSNDNENWTIIDTHTDEAYRFQFVNKEEFTFIVNDANTYTFFKFSATQLGDGFQMGEFWINEQTHTWGTPTETASTCAVQGKKVWECSDCHALKTEALPLAAHTYEDGVCTVCGAEFSRPVLLANGQTNPYPVKFRHMDGDDNPVDIEANWNTAAFDDSAWDELTMPIGSPGYDSGAHSGARYNTLWYNEHNTYWFRRTFEVINPSIVSKLTLKTLHDDNYKVYINGHLVDEWDHWTDGTNWSSFEIEPADVDLAAGTNVVAMYIEQNTGGAYCDFSLEAQISTSVDVTVSDANYTTFVAPYNIPSIPEGVEAYACQVQTNHVHLEPVSAIPQGEAVVLKNTGSYTFASTTSSVSLGTTNDLQPSDGTVTGAAGNIYALAKKGEVGFYRVGDDVTVPAGKGYLVIGSGSGSGNVKAFYGFDEDDATSINEELRVKNEESEAVIYNVAGQRMNKVQKGINIINGKKTIK